ncbi:MAG TPA: FKBP-type peptidyl-prolyl cis-trans isomerase, partial [Planctomycetota bacterium]|nr:FKBP-type peptidyl-prolyl cis-trans isomerase [Planctomycetota bacterium]
GVQYQDVLQGLGPEVTPTSEVTLDYRVTLSDQTVVDSTYDRGQALTFPMGSAPILGWEETLLGMRAGGRRVAEIPPALGYGEEGIEGLVPPNASLLCEFEMLEVADPRPE